MNDNDILKEVVATCKKAGNFIRTESLSFDRNHVQEKKSFSDLVSYVDKQAEKMIVESLAKIDPSWGFIAEEGTGNQSDGWNWIIDPLDGTTNFIHGLPAYCVSVALAKGNDLQIAVIYDIPHDECFTAIKGQGAWCNEKPIRVSNAKTMQQSLVATGFPYYDFEKLAPYLKVLEAIMNNSRGLRRMGSAAIDLAYTACGRFDAFFEYNLNAWDVAAGILLVREAGGTVTDFTGGDDCLFGRSLVCGSPAIQKELIEVIQKEW